MTTERDNISLQWLKPSDLDVEPLAQRDFVAAKAENIVKRFDPDKVGEFKVTHRGGRYFVTDGQHRRAALIEKGLGEIEVPCVVREDQTIADDAKQFIAANVEGNPVNILDAHRVKVVAGDKEAIDIQAVLDAFDLKVTFAGGPNDISAIAALQWIYRLGGSDLIVRTLTLVEATWGRERPARDGHILKAIALILSKIGDQIDLESFAAKVQADSTPGRVIGTARTQVLATRLALYKQVAEVLINIYNKQRSTRRLSLSS